MMEKRHIDSLKAILANNKANYIDNVPDTAPYVENYRPVDGIKKGEAALVLLPENTEQVSQILSYCNKNNIKIFPQGGNTGLVGGSIPDQTGKGIVLSTKRMDKIISDINESSSSVRLGAGVIIDTLNEKAAEHGRFCSIKHGGTGSSNIGGNIATNSGGANALKYGVTKDQVLGFTVVLPDGKVTEYKPNMKDTTGINTRDIFIGSEGTLGVITEAVIKLHPKPKSVETMLIAVDKIEDVDRLYNDLEKSFYGSIEAFEYMNNEAFNLAADFTKGADNIPLNISKEHFLLIEISSYDKDSETLQDALVNFMDDKGKVNFEGRENSQGYIDIEDIMISMSESDKELMWLVREHCGVSSKELSGSNGVWFDDCVPLDKIKDSIYLTKERLSESFPEAMEKGLIRTPLFGHYKDGNLHLHIIQPERTIGKEFNINEHAEEIENIRLGVVDEVGGNPYAEHGVGTKTHRMKYIPQEQIEIMKKIKRSIDPKNILNPGRVLDSLEKGQSKWSESYFVNRPTDNQTGINT